MAKGKSGGPRRPAAPSAPRKAVSPQAQARKRARREAQEAAHSRNVARGVTGWDLAKKERAARRVKLQRKHEQL